MSCFSGKRVLVEGMSGVIVRSSESRVLSRRTPSEFSDSSRQCFLWLKAIAPSIILLILLAACKHQTSGVDNDNQSQNISDSSAPPLDEHQAAAGENVEYLDWNLVMINNKLLMACKKDELFTVLGQPDSVVNPVMDEICASFFQDGFQYVYIKGSEFEVHGDSAVMRSLNFESFELVDSAHGFVFNKSVTLTDIGKLFPQATANAQEISNDRLFKTILVVLPTGNANTGDAWYLFFNNGRLTSLDYWLDC